MIPEALCGGNCNLVEQLADKIYKAQCFECESYYKPGFASSMVIERKAQELRV